MTIRGGTGFADSYYGDIGFKRKWASAPYSKEAPE
jgi:hypothetical protein